jgi:hypothetical protein
MTFGTPKDKRLRKPTSNRVKMLKTGRIGQSWANHYISASRLPLHPSLGLPNTPYPLTPRQVLLNDGSVGIHGVDPQLSHAALAFVHGGLAPGYGCLTPFPSCINRVSKSLLQKLQKTLKVSLITGQLKENIPRGKFYTN